MDIKHEETVTKVLEALESIRPFLNKDGELIDVVGDKVFVRLLGNCSSCPISFSTMKLGVETTIKQMAPEIKEVLSIED